VGFFSEAMIPMMIVAVISSVFVGILHAVFVNPWIGAIASGMVSTITIGFLVYFMGLSAQEKLWIRNWISSRKKVG